MRSRPPPSFAERLVRYGLTVAVPVLLLCGVLVYHHSVESYRSMESKTLATAHELANALDSEIDSLLLLIETLSGVLGPEMDLARLHRTVTETLVPRGAHVVVHDVGGWQILSTFVPFGTPLEQSVDTEGVRAVIKGEKPFYSGLAGGPVAGEKYWVVSAPLQRHGKVAGVVSIVQHAIKLNGLLSGQFRRPDPWRFGISDHSGTILADSVDPDRFVGMKLSEEMIPASKEDQGVGWVKSMDGTASVRGFTRSQRTGWTVSVSVPSAAVDAPLRQTWLLFGFGSAVLLSLALSLAIASARALHGNVEQLVASARRLGRGDPLVAQSFVTREFRHIHDALESAAAERSSSEERRQLLLRELQHRTNNLLAVISSIIRRTIVEGRSLLEARDMLMGRLQALANASDTLAAAHWQGAEIGRVIESEMQAFAGRYSARGPKVLLSAQAAQNMSLVIHELATNASKHGALSAPGGLVTIRWRIEGAPGDPSLSFEWVERGGPPASPPARRGFGYTLLESVLTDIYHKPEIGFEARGLTYRTSVRLVSIVAGAVGGSLPPAQSPARETPREPLRRAG